MYCIVPSRLVNSATEKKIRNIHNYTRQVHVASAHGSMCHVTNYFVIMPHSYSIQHGTDYKFNLMCVCVCLSVCTLTVAFLIDFRQKQHGGNNLKK